MPEPRRLAFIAILIAGALVSTYVLTSLTENEPGSGATELSLAYYLDQAELIGTAPDGAVLYKVKTEHAEQSKKDNSVEMQSIEMKYGPPTGLPWDVRADRGRIPGDASIIELRGNVLAVSGPAHPDRTTISTQQLDIDPEAMQASSSSKVTIEFDNRRLYSTGLEADFRTNRLRLLSNVHGKFNP